MIVISVCPPDDPGLLALVDAMTAELVPLYGLPPDAEPAPLAPDARHLLAIDGGKAVGCCAVQPLGQGVCELKRMYVDPAKRGKGLAVRLLERAERTALDLEAERMRLETGIRQPAAVRLYERAGYRRIPSYPPHDRDPESLCFEKTLRPR
ncbi:GNAT family N-acetyltransferase [Microbispora corallina]|uniref:N-acetyltransferase n=1 Tax=Microbispora corallina TaxID=83302 RepID=A0ABQ4G1M5_9ACTN|nr:GNAT family N-acetyltransferase [Microbispora corallina]GIH40969.1 N-acetyltransferase [Microbispora corallina]